MKIIKNEKLIKRNGRIGQWTTIAALGVLGGGMYLTFANANNPKFITYSLFALLGGFVLTQVGLYMGNRWGRSPRPDEQLDAALKGLPGEFTIYHYATPASHLLVGPAGVWVLLSYRQRGVVTYSKNRWRVGSGGFLQAYMSIFGQEGIGRPDLEADSQANSVAKALSKNLSGKELPSIQSILVFANDTIEIEANDAPIPAIKIKQLKDFMRQKAKEVRLSTSMVERVRSVFEQ